MTCSKCNTEGVLNTVLGKDFYYCRTCKDEIQLERANKGAFLQAGIDAAKNNNWGQITVGPGYRPAWPTPPVPTPAPSPSKKLHNWNGAGLGAICTDCGINILSVGAQYCPAPAAVAPMPQSQLQAAASAPAPIPSPYTWGQSGSNSKQHAWDLNGDCKYCPVNVASTSWKPSSCLGNSRLPGPLAQGKICTPAQAACALRPQSHDYFLVRVGNKEYRTCKNCLWETVTTIP